MPSTRSSSDTRVYKVPVGGNEFFTETREVIDVAGHPDSYRLKAICMNCKWEGQVRIARGQRASKGLGGSGYECPACGCSTVEPGSLAGRDTPEDDSRDAMEKDRKRRAEWREAEKTLRAERFKL